MKDYVLNLFPLLSEEWECDDGQTVMQEYEAVKARQEELNAQWSAFSEDPSDTFVLDSEDVMLMQICLIPEEEDTRPELTWEQTCWLSEQYNKLAESPYLTRDEYRALMERLTGSRNSPRQSSVLMRRRFLVQGLTKCGLAPIGQQFECNDETGTLYIADMVAVLTVMGTECAVYLLPNAQGGIDILSSRVEKDENGFDVLRPMRSPTLTRLIDDFVQKRLDTLKKQQK
ncbi:MAG: hypothetical protein IJ484_05975 [Oscillospiraceae bacterium]|nr:hypothetical protein [Oscillospiraceae bacterium]